MSTNITALIIVLIIFGSIIVLFSLLYLIFVCYNKIKHYDNPIGETEPFFEITY
jgi:hypothetical protein